MQDTADENADFPATVEGVDVPFSIGAASGNFALDPAMCNVVAGSGSGPTVEVIADRSRQRIGLVRIDSKRGSVVAVRPYVDWVPDAETDHQRKCDRTDIEKTSALHGYPPK